MTNHCHEFLKDQTVILKFLAARARVCVCVCGREREKDHKL